MMPRIPRNDDGTFADDWDDYLDDDFDGQHPWETAVYADYDTFGVHAEIDARGQVGDSEAAFAINVDEISCDSDEIMEVAYVYFQLTGYHLPDSGAEDSDNRRLASTTAAVTINGDRGLPASDGDVSIGIDPPQDPGGIEGTRSATYTDGLLAGPITSYENPQFNDAAATGTGSGGGNQHPADVDVDFHEVFGEGPYVDENDDIVISGQIDLPVTDSSATEGAEVYRVVANVYLAGISYELESARPSFGAPW